MKNFLSIIGAFAVAAAIFAAVAIIVKKVKFKFVISSADAELCDYDCESCDDVCEAYDEEDDLFDGWDDDGEAVPEVEVEICEIKDDVAAEVEDELEND